MLFLRSIAFTAAFYVNLVVWMICALPVLALPRGALTATIRAWAHTNLFLMRVLVGTRYEIRGREHIPLGECLVACKHQSTWETFALFLVLRDPCFILKRELLSIPIFGWYCRKARLVAVNRGGRSVALKSMNEGARRAMEEGRQVVIFPEGTRRAPGAEPAYKVGVAFLYTDLNVPCVPIGLNSGYFWPRRGLFRQPGTIVLDIVEPIPLGLERDEFFRRVQADIEGSSDTLLAALPNAP